MGKQIDPGKLWAYAQNDQISFRDVGRLEGVTTGEVWDQWVAMRGEREWTPSVKERPLLPGPDDDTLRRLAKDPNVTAGQVGREYKLSATTVHRRWKDLSGGEQWERKGHTFEQLQDPEWLAEAAKRPGFSYREAGEEIGASGPTVSAAWAKIANGRPWVRTHLTSPYWLFEQAADPTVTYKMAAAEAKVSLKTLITRWGKVRGERLWKNTGTIERTVRDRPEDEPWDVDESWDVDEEYNDPDW